MSKEDLFDMFEQMFPNWAERVTTYKKIGSRTLAIKFKEFGETVIDQNEVSRVFLYKGPNNWQFGTKMWRKKPNPKKRADIAGTEYDASERTEAMGR